MGLRTTLTALAPTAGTKAAAEAAGDDLAGLLQVVNLRLTEAAYILADINTRLATPAGDTTFATALTLATGTTL
jgi:hypothetical protein